MSLCLTRDELTELTGRKQRAKIAEWLIDNGYKFDLAADGWPKVLRAAVEARLMPSQNKRKITSAQPDFTAYDTPSKAA